MKCGVAIIADSKFASDLWRRRIRHRFPHTEREDEFPCSVATLSHVACFFPSIRGIGPHSRGGQKNARHRESVLRLWRNDEVRLALEDNQQFGFFGKIGFLIVVEILQ